MSILKTIKILIVTILVLFASFPDPNFALTWRELKGDHFIVYITEDEEFGRKVLSQAEAYYQRIASDLGYVRYSDFWTWDNRVKIYIHPNQKDYLEATGQPEWSKGMADYTNKQIVSFVWSEGFLESLLPHEMGHLIFRDFVGFRSDVPLWLDEGVAQWEEESKRKEIKLMVKKYLNEDALLSLNDMMRLDIRRISTTEKVYIRSTASRKGDAGILVLNGESLINLYYLQAVSIVGFLIERYGSERFVQFCRELRDGKGIDESLRVVYPNSIKNIQGLSQEWINYVEEEKNEK